MFRRRKTLQSRDRESGLAFSWRVPLSSGGSFAVAMLLVGLGALVLSASVRISLGRPQSEEASRASVVIIPRDRGGARIEREALEAGPFPVRWNPAADREYAALRKRALREAADVPLPYVPSQLQIQMSESGESGNDPSGLVVLPALPARVLKPESDPAPREVGHGLRVLTSKDGVTLLHATLFLPAVESTGVVGVRYMIDYDRDGRVLEVTRLDSGDPQASVVEWVARARVEGHQGEPGWVVVESVIGS